MADSLTPGKPGSGENNLTKEDQLRKRLIQILGADRWIACDYPTVAPNGADEVQKLLKERPAPVVAVGQGSSFPEDFEPNIDTIILLTSAFKSTFDLSEANQTLTVDAGYRIVDVNKNLRESGYVVPALSKFTAGSVGGRLASVSSRPLPNRHDGWIQSLLGLEVVMPSGEYFKMGGSCIKDVAGFDLKHLFTGSRGNIGIIVKATFRIYPISLFTNLEEMNTASEKARNIKEERTPAARSFSPGWKRLLDPMGRMDQGA